MANKNGVFFLSELFVLPIERTNLEERTVRCRLVLVGMRALAALRCPSPPVHLLHDGSGWIQQLLNSIENIERYLLAVTLSLAALSG